MRCVTSISPLRERVIGAADGRVLEIGVGSGRNLPFYRPPTKQIPALEPCPKLVDMARSVPHPGTHVSFLEASAELIPLDDGAVDTVVTTWTLCSVPHAPTALGEMRRYFVRAEDCFLSSAGWRQMRASVGGKTG